MQRWFDVFAFRIGRPEDRRVAMLFTDITAKRQGEAERERLLSVAEGAERRLAFLAEASVRLAGSLDVEATLATIAELAVPSLADWCFVEVLEEGRVRQVAITHVRPEMVELARASLARNPIDLDAEFTNGKQELRRAALIRTARRIFEGRVLVPEHVWTGPETKEDERESTAALA